MNSRGHVAVAWPYFTIYRKNRDWLQTGMIRWWKSQGRRFLSIVIVKM